jgi:hypothetical protein
MRRVEAAVQEFRRTGPTAPDAYLAFLARVLKPRLADAQTGQALSAASDPVLAPLEGLAGPADGPRLIVP